MIAECDSVEPTDEVSVAALQSCRVYTPDAVAAAMIAAIEGGPPGLWLDPCVGQGAFTSAMAKRGISTNEIVGVDLESRETQGIHGQIRWGTDFIEWAAACNLRFSRIVANPPFIALRRLPSKLQSAALALTVDGKKKLRPGGNYWTAFLCASVGLLERDGQICFLLPASWEYADYAAAIRDHLPSQFETFEAHRSMRPLFPKVQDGSVVIIGRGFGRPAATSTYFEYANPNDLCIGVGGSPDALTTSTTIAPLNSKGPFSEATVRLGEILEVSIGAVTGDAPYFLMSEQRRRDLALPTKSLRPVLTHAKQLLAAIVDMAVWQKLRSEGERVWLFRPPRSYMSHPSVRSYLRLSARAGGCRRGYKISNRRPWHRTPLPRRADGFVSGMSRLGPWISLSRMSNITVTNTLYTVRFRKRCSEADKAAWCLALLTSSARSWLRPLGRRYADGLLKFEPSDLENIRVPRPGSSAGAMAAYERSVSALLAGNPVESCRIADDWLFEASGPGGV
jgi:adenine-specific DNA-methyltransferase